MRNPLPTVVSGPGSITQAIGLILRTPALWPYSILPVILSLGLTTFLFTTLRGYLAAQLVAWLATIGWTASWIVSFTQILLTILAWVAAALTYSILASLVSLPFNDPLSKATEKALQNRGWNLAPYQEVSFTHSMWIDLKKTIVCGVGQMSLIFLSLILFFIPGFQLVTLTANAFLIAYQFLSYPQTRRGEETIASARLLFRFPLRSLVYGGCLLLGFLLPVVSGLMIPVAVVSGTIYYLRLNGQGPSRDQSLT